MATGPQLNLDLQQRISALETELKELRDFIDNAAVGLHWVGPDGTILWANDAELSLLGYRRDEYIGRNIADFHVDKTVIRDILRRLQRNEVLKVSMANY